MIDSSRIRNFCIIAHIDHGKSTLADRMLEITQTVPERKMRSQYLDQMDLEQERGITIKMAPVRMRYKSGTGEEHVLNLIDTPGHSDFSYEVSRALAAVEGAILLVDATQGIQAQTLANLRSARAAGLTIIGAVNKIDLNPLNLLEIVFDIAHLLQCDPADILRVSGKTGEGVLDLLQAVVKRVPPPKIHGHNVPQALIFDSTYNDHKGVIASVRVMEGVFTGKDIRLVGTGEDSKIKELGFFVPQQEKTSTLSRGEIGYIATGIKDPRHVRIGDTIVEKSPTISDYSKYMLSGYRVPRPVVFVSFYPNAGDELELLERALDRLQLNDSSLLIQPDNNEILGRGFKVGFLGRLHFEIVAERLRREFGVSTITTFPSVLYRVKLLSGEYIEVVKPEDLPLNHVEIWEPMVRIEILLPSEYLSALYPLQARFRFRDITTHTFSEEGGVGGDRVRYAALMPLVELVSDFDDQLKSVTAGFASFSYELAEYAIAELMGVEILLSGQIVPGLSRFFPKATAEREARKMVERLKEFLPQQQFAQAIQAQSNGRIIARETIVAMRKDVTGYLYGGDRTRKMKLWKKQQRGKKLLKERASETQISPDIFKELLKK